MSRIPKSQRGMRKTPHAPKTKEAQENYDKNNRKK